jgi:hypothetical protein
MTDSEYKIEEGLHILARGIEDYVRANQKDNHMALPWGGQIAGSIPEMKRVLFLALTGRFAVHFMNEDTDGITLHELTSKGHPHS